MASNHKTQNLGLNSWSGSDRPQMADFNRDNAIIDSVLGAHYKNQELHVTPEEKQKWNVPTEFSAYFGTNADSREIKLGYRPTAVFVYPQDRPMLQIDFNTRRTLCFFGSAGREFNSRGIAITSDGFTVRNNYLFESTTNDLVMLNASDTNYIFLAWK